MSLQAIKLLLFMQYVVHSSRILGIFNEKSFSHQIMGTKLLFELTSRGHHVTMLTPVVPKLQVENFTAIQLDLKGLATESAPNLFETRNMRTWDRVVHTDAMGLMWTKAVLNDVNVQRLLKSNLSFDVVIVDQLKNHALTGFCYHYKAMCVIFSGVGSTWNTNQQMKNSNNPSFMPDMYVNYPPRMNFYQRLHNVFAQYLQSLYFYTYTIHKHNELLQEYFPGAPNIDDIFYNISLMLLNSHYSIGNPLPYLSNVVEVGGLHIALPKKLPNDIEKFLNESEHGVIYFSMGSILKVQNMDKSKLHAIVNSLGRLQQKVLWVTNGIVPSELPRNVITKEWLPQLDVLAHPNIRLFITQGGYLSISEAISCGVPILGIPVFGDQGLHLAYAELVGYGIGVPYVDLSIEKFDNALKELLNNSFYMEKAKKRSRIFHDQPMKPLDRAVFWIEYVIRYKGAPHLRSAAFNLRWYQYLLLDILFAAILLTITTGYLFWKVFILFVYKGSRKAENEIVSNNKDPY